MPATTIAVYYKKPQTNSKEKKKTSAQIKESNQPKQHPTLEKKNPNKQFQSVPAQNPESLPKPSYLALPASNQGVKPPAFLQVFPSPVSGNGFRCHILVGTLSIYLYIWTSHVRSLSQEGGFM